MKLFVHYEGSENVSAHKTLKLTLPKSWRSGPTSKILNQFVESYNESLPLCPPLDSSLLHLALFRQSPDSPAREKTQSDSEQGLGIFDPVPYDAITSYALSDHDHVYVRIGPSQSMSELGKSYSDRPMSSATTDSSSAPDVMPSKPVEPLLRCTNFGCKVQFPKDCAKAPTPCIHHAGPPVFHETAKFWSCCPNKRAYDWDEFENITGCIVDEAGCTHVPKNNTRNFLGGCDLRAEAVDKSNNIHKLRSIEDFNNQSQLGNKGNDQTSIVTRLRNILHEIGIEHELFDQVVEGIQKKCTTEAGTNILMDKVVADELGANVKKTLKAMAVDQLRIK